MTAPTRNGRASAEANDTPVVVGTGAIRRGPTFEKDSGIPTAAELDGLFPNDFLLDRVREAEGYVVVEIIGDCADA